MFKDDEGASLLSAYTDACKPLEPTRVANFVMEIGLRSEIPTYSGGLGILAGDYAFSLAEKGVPAVFVSLLYRKGYTRQKLDRNAGQIDSDASFEPARFLSPLKSKVPVELNEKTVWVGAWGSVIRGKVDVPVIFLHTDLPENDEEGRMITDRLYGGDLWHRLSQETVLGVGGYRMLKALAYHVDIYHLHEGHAALVSSELMREHKSREEVRKRVVFTTHTPVPAGIDIFPVAMVKQAFQRAHGMDWDSEAEDGRINLSRLALHYSGLTNAVSLKHRFVAESILRHKGIEYVTNGVNHLRWVHAELRRVYDRHTPGWEESPSLLGGALTLPSEELASAHQAAKAEMLGLVRDRTGIRLEKDALTIGQAKRVTAYKSNNLILRNPERLIELASRHGKIQLIFSGKTHPADDVGKGMLRDILDKGEQLEKASPDVRLVYLEDYDIDTARALVAGCDVWLNSPRRPLEACGTSGMKAAINGVLNLSSQDGWWLEAGIDGVNGWCIGKRSGWHDISTVSSESEDAQDVYDKLSSQILPLYYQNKDEWWTIAKRSIATIGPNFSCYRMVDDYVSRLYSKLRIKGALPQETPELTAMPAVGRPTQNPSSEGAR